MSQYYDSSIGNLEGSTPKVRLDKGSWFAADLKQGRVQAERIDHFAGQWRGLHVGIGGLLDAHYCNDELDAAILS
jgi:hypothetical protein